jgi:hypothetical protein
MAETLVKYVTPVFRVSFPNLFEPQAVNGGKPKYGLSAVWTPSQFTELDKKRWVEIKKAMDAESMRAFKKPLKDLPANIKRGLRNGNEKELEGYGEGTIFASLTTKLKPGIVNLDKTPIGPEHGNDDLIYPGMFARATVVVYSYSNEGKGIALGLMNLQRVKDGERLDSRTEASADFDDDLDGVLEPDTSDFLDD